MRIFVWMLIVAVVNLLLIYVEASPVIAYMVGTTVTLLMIINFGNAKDK